MLKVEADGPVLFATLSRPEVRNAFNDELIMVLHDLFVGQAAQCRAVILAGEGKAFCAGGDLEWMRKAAAYTEEQNYQDALKLAQLFDAIVHCPALVIAKVHGAAFGGGCGLVAAADVAVAAEGSLFAFSEVRLGLVPATISTFVIPKIGAGNARAYFATGEAFDAQTALRIGLVHQVCSPEELDSVVQEKLNTILRNGPEAVATSKRVAVDGPYNLEDSARLLAKARSGEEGREGVAAFLDKRPANFVVER